MIYDEDDPLDKPFVGLYPPIWLKTMGRGARANKTKADDKRRDYGGGAMYEYHYDCVVCGKPAKRMIDKRRQKPKFCGEACKTARRKEQMKAYIARVKAQND